MNNIDLFCDVDHIKQLKKIIQKGLELHPENTAALNNVKEVSLPQLCLYVKFYIFNTFICHLQYVTTFYILHFTMYHQHQQPAIVVTSTNSHPSLYTPLHFIHQN